MTTISLATLIIAETRDTIYAKMIQLAQVIGLNTESWRAGDPTRTLFDASARVDEAKELATVQAIKAGFLSLSSGVGRTMCAKFFFNEDRIGATAATVSITITNTGGELYTFDPDDLTVALDLDPEVTYRNDDAVVLPAGASETVGFTAEIVGASGSAGIGDITTLVSEFPDLEVTNTSAAVGRDEESDDALEARCLAKWGSLSPSGPKGGLHYVATTPELVNDRTVTRTRVLADTTDGTKILFLADDVGSVSGATVTDVEAGCEYWANPHCHDLTVLSATDEVVPVTYQMWVYDSIPMTDDAILEAVETKLVSEFKTRPIGGDVIPPATNGALYKGFVEAKILEAVGRYGFRATCSAPAADVVLTLSDAVAEVAKLGTVTGTIHRIASV